MNATAGSGVRTPDAGAAMLAACLPRAASPSERSPSIL